MMNLHHEWNAALREPLEEGELPERSIVAEGAHAGAPGVVEHRVEVATSGDGAAAGVPHNAEVRIHHLPQIAEI